MRRFCVTFSLLSAALTTAGTVQGANSTAAELIEEVVVTAEFREAPASELPGSYTVLRPDRERDAVNHLEEVLNRAPNVNFASGASRGRYVQIRGIGERGQFSEPLNSSVGLIVDGVDLSGVGAAATLFDVQQVEVLRGPRGTLYGANALAGLINIVTPEPTAMRTARVQADVGDYGQFGVGAVVSGPLSDSAGYRLGVQRHRDDGFMDNEFLGRENTGNRDELTARAKFTWGEALRWQLALGHVDVDNGYDAFSLDNDRNTLSDEPGGDEQETTYASLAMAQDLSERVAFEGSVALTESDLAYGYDEDWTFTGFDPIGYTSTDLYERERDTQTLELRFLSQPGAYAWDWVAGVYALRQDVALDRTYTFAGPFSSSFEIARTAIYGEVSRRVSDLWRFSVGGRIEHHSSEYDDTAGVSFDPDENLYGARVLLERDVGDNGLFYAGVTRGYKTGGFNQDGTLPASLREFDTETLWNVELGYKDLFLEDRLTLAVAVFRMQREDIQIQTSRQDPRPGSAPGEFVVFRGNATDGFNQGVEVESTLALNDRVTLFASAGLLDTEYDRFLNANQEVVDGREQAHAPEYQFFLGAQVLLTDRLSVAVEVEGKDEFFFSDTHDEVSESYELLNASLVYAGDNWSARLWGRNLTDEDYFVRGFFFGNDPRDFYTARPFTQLGEPARVGLSVSVDL